MKKLILISLFIMIAASLSGCLRGKIRTIDMGCNNCICETIMLQENGSYIDMYQRQDDCKGETK